MKKIFLLSLCLTLFYNVANSCTNFIVGKNASVDGSVMCTYNADDYGMFAYLTYLPAATHTKGETRKIFDVDTKEFLGEIPEAEVTYSVIGNINEYQVSIGETTFGGREEMVDSTGILDYGSLMHIAMQRSKTAREAIKVMTTLAESYGYCSEGETFSICDKDEAWIMEMMGCGAGSKKVVWVAIRIPDDAISAHANQSRIRTFNQKDKKNVMFSKNCISFAREKGWFSKEDKDFSFCETYAYPDFEGRRFCEARVWSFFNHFSSDMDRYLPYAQGKVDDTEPLPLWIIPNKKVSLQDIEASMRDHYEGTPFSLLDDNDPGKGIWNMPYRPTPLSFTVDGKKCFNERPTSTQQTGFSYVAQMRSWLPRQIGGILWFGNDDGNMVAYTPIYCGNTTQPNCYNTKGADAVTFNENNAYWVCNWVSNMVYPRYSLMFEAVKQVRDSLENSYFLLQEDIETKALELYKESPQKAIEFLNDYSCTKAEEMLQRWKSLAIYLIVKYNDMAIKPEEDGKFSRTSTGIGVPVERPGYPENIAREIIELTGERYLVPQE